MSVNGVSATSTTLVTRNPELLEALGQARAIIARPGKPENDRYFVKDVLGATEELASAKRRSLLKLLHEDRLRGMGATPDEIETCKEAYNRVHVSWTTTKNARALPPTASKLAEQNSGLSGVLVTAAGIAGYSLRATREAIQQKIDDGTLDAFASQVRSTAGDLFEASLAVGRNWFDAIRRPSTKED